MNEDPYLGDRKCAACGIRGVAVDGDICGLCRLMIRNDPYGPAARRTLYIIAGVTGAVVAVCMVVLWWFWR